MMKQVWPVGTAPLMRVFAILVLALAVLWGFTGPGSGWAAAAAGCPSVSNTPKFSIAYGTVTLNGAAAPAGTVVEARSPRGHVVGCFVVSQAGSYGAMYIFGQDISVSPPVPGMRAGEGIAFLVNGAAAAASAAPSWSEDKDLHQTNLTASDIRTLKFNGQPGKGAHGFALGVNPVIQVQEGGSTVTGDNSTVISLRIKPGSGTPGATLSCGAAGTSQRVSAGLARWGDPNLPDDDCTIDLKGQGYVLEAVADGTSLGATAPFDVVWAGDSNGDCGVDILDFSALARSYGRKLGDAGYDPRPDLNGDNQVGLVDFSLLVTLFGTRCPSLGLSPTSGPGGSEVGVTGSAYVASRDVSVTFDGVAVGAGQPATVTDGSGSFSTSFTVPPGTASGFHTVKATQANGRVVAAATLVVP